MKKAIHIKKQSGESQLFDVNKLIKSLRRSRASEDLVQEIAFQIQEQVQEGTTTKKIYQQAFKMLRNKSRVSASKYKLKKALMELGPTGFPFEKLIGKLMETEGFTTQIGIIVQGNCVPHEIDVIARKDNKHYVIECKYHSDPNRFCNVKTPLYIHSRFLDVEKNLKLQKEHDSIIHKGGLYTNTRFTSDAIQYGTCVGLLLTSWDYPQGNGLKERIDASGLHPITALTTLTNAEKSKLLEAGIVICKELLEDPKLLEKIGVENNRHRKILDDSGELCKGD